MTQNAAVTRNADQTHRPVVGHGIGLSSLSDEQLCTCALDGSREAALDELIRRYAPRLRRLLCTLVGPDRDLIEEGEQEVFVTLVRRLSCFRGESRFSTFFFALARNRVRDMLRARRRRVARYSATQIDPETIPGRSQDPGQRVIDSERLDGLRRCMAVLSEDDRILLFLRDGDDTPIAELSRIYSIPEGTVKSRLSRARARVARRMRELEYG